LFAKEIIFIISGFPRAKFLIYLLLWDLYTELLVAD